MIRGRSHISAVIERLRQLEAYERAVRTPPPVLLEKRYVRVRGGYLNRWLIREERLVMVFPPRSECGHLLSSPLPIKNFALLNLGKPWEAGE